MNICCDCLSCWFSSLALLMLLLIASKSYQLYCICHSAFVLDWIPLCYCSPISRLSFEPLCHWGDFFHKSSYVFGLKKYNSYNPAHSDHLLKCCITLMVALLRVFLWVVGEHNSIPRNEQILTHQQDVSSGGQLTTCYLLALPDECQSVKKSHILLWRGRHSVADINLAAITVI